MLPLESLAPGLSPVGVDPTLVVSVVAVVPIGEGAVQLVYKTADGTLKDRLLTGNIDRIERCCEDLPGFLCQLSECD